MFWVIGRLEVPVNDAAVGRHVWHVIGIALQKQRKDKACKEVVDEGFYKTLLVTRGISRPV